MKQGVLVLCCAIVFSCYGQEDSISLKEFQLGYTDISRNDRLVNPVFVVKGDEIRRFPAMNFLEAMNGLFPWVFSYEPNANDFLYVVDGNQLADINAISLYDIEEIIFMRGNLEAGNYPFAKRGCFIIRTKAGTAAKGLSFNANAGFTTFKSGRPYALFSNPALTYDSVSSTGMLQNYQLSYSGQVKDKTSYFLSGNYIYEKDPPVTLSQTSQQNTGTFRYDRRTSMFRLHAGASIDILPVLKLDLQTIAALQKSRIDSANSFSPSGFMSEAESKLPDNYFTVLASLHWKINRSFLNTVSFTYSNDQERMDMWSSTTNLINTAVSDTNKLKTGVVENNFSFISNVEKQLRIKAGLSLQYNFINFRKAHLRITTQNNQPYSAEGSWNTGNMKWITGVPYFSMEFKSYISLYGGLQIFIKSLEGGSFKMGKSSNWMPYAGTVFSLMNVLPQNKVLTRLDLGGHYSKRNSNRTDFYRLEKKELPHQLYPASPYTFNSPNNFNKDEIFSLQATAGFLDDRFLVGAEWSKATEELIFVLNIPTPGPPSQIAYLGELETRGIAFFASAQIIQKEKWNWNIRLNAVKQEKINPDLAGSWPGYYPFSAGFQNNVNIGDFFMQINGVMGFDKEISLSFSNTTKVDDLSLNYVLLGYKLSPNKKWLSDLQLFIQAKNLVASKTTNSYQDWPRYFGVGLNTTF